MYELVGDLEEARVTLVREDERRRRRTDPKRAVRRLRHRGTVLKLIIKRERLQGRFTGIGCDPPVGLDGDVCVIRDSEFAS